jgi:hypothetical protein
MLSLPSRDHHDAPSSRSVRPLRDPADKLRDESSTAKYQFLPVVSTIGTGGSPNGAMAARTTTIESMGVAAPVKPFKNVTLAMIVETFVM